MRKAAHGVASTRSIRKDTRVAIQVGAKGPSGWLNGACVAGEGPRQPTGESCLG
jgi:hypothetical protein